MGCGIRKHTQCTISSLYSNKEISKRESYTQLQLMMDVNRNDNQHRLSETTLLKVLDLLPYNDLKEAGKVSRMFNILSKNSSVLVKFFQKRNQSFTDLNDIRNTNKATTCFTSFFVLQDNISVCSLCNKKNSITVQ